MQNPVTSHEARSRRLQVQQRVLNDARDRLTISTASSIGATFIAYPFLRAKILSQCIPEFRLQKKAIPFKGGFSAAYHIFKNEGMRRYWRGAVPLLAFATPTLFAKHLATLNFAQDIQNQPSVSGSIWRGFAVAAIYSTVSSVFNVFEMVSTKMATDIRLPENVNILGADKMAQSTTIRSVLQDVASNADSKSTAPSTTPSTKQPSVTYSPYKFRNSVYTLKRIYTLNGASKFAHAILPLYFQTFGHFSAIFCFSALASITGMDNYTPTTSTLAIAVLSTFLMHPFDTIRHRMFYRLPTTPDYRIKPYKNMLECTKYIWDHEGVKGFYRGSGNSVNVLVLSLLVSALSTSWLNASRRSTMKSDYINKVHQYAADDRLRRLQDNRATTDSLFNDDDINTHTPRD